MAPLRGSTALSASVLLAACLGVVAAPGVADPGVTPPAHVVVVVMENHSAAGILGNPSAPYLNSFYRSGTAFTNFREGSATGPSLPDYLQLAAGSSCGKTTDTTTAGDPAISAAGCTTTLWNQLQARGKSWGVYMDGMPAPCSSVVTYKNVTYDTPYALKHNPAVPFPSVWGDQAMCKAHVLPFTSFDPTAMPAVSFVAPGICNDHHGTSTGTPYSNCVMGSSAMIKRGDDWLAARVPAMLANGATVLITYDESGTLYAAEVGPGVPVTTDPTPYTHYSVLAAIEQAYGLDELNAAASATPVPLPAGPPPGPDQPPVAAAGITCPTLGCTFDATATTDPEGGVSDYAWDFGDGSTGSGVVTQHDYAAAGIYSWTLTATDDAGATGETSGSVEVSDPALSTVRYVGSAGAAASTKTPSVQVPVSGQAGDLLLLALDVTTSTVTVFPPTGVGGWTALPVSDAGGMKSQVWWKLADAADPGARVTVPLGSGIKGSLRVLDYAGVDPTQPIQAFATAADLTSTTRHTSPLVAAGSGDWVVSLWSGKSSTSPAWTAPAGVVPRVGTTTGAGTVVISTLAADSGQGVGLVPYGGLAATTSTPTSRAIMWTIALADAGSP